MNSPAHTAGDRRSNRGVTLIEVAVAALVMALVLSTSITTLQRAFISLQNARDLNIASQMLQSEMEKMRLSDWTTINAYPTAATTLALDSTFTSNPFVGSRFVLSRTVTDPKTDTRIITLRIEWQGADNRPLFRRLSMRYSRNGLYDYFYSQI
ncbi:MAG TPA: prepilin-type N-terminal cleavage/methylation domain-containing protein [Lacunisphaera sp.]|nr:prepilin-type N-terminal cleavage/methylation domain-containing protein [Lacunisphaera sp.]